MASSTATAPMFCTALALRRSSPAANGDFCTMEPTVSEKMLPAATSTTGSDSALASAACRRGSSTMPTPPKPRASPAQVLADSRLPSTATASSAVNSGCSAPMSDM